MVALLTLHPKEVRTYFLQALEAKGMPLEDVNEGCNVSHGGHEQFIFECKIENFPFYFKYRQGTHYDVRFRMREYWGTGDLLDCEVYLSTDGDTYAFITKLIDDVHQMIELVEQQRLLRVGWNQVGLEKKMPPSLVRNKLIDEFLEENK